MKIRILVADGDRLLGKQLKVLLCQEGYEVDLVSDGISALKHFRRYEYHYSSKKSKSSIFPRDAS